MLPSLSLLFVFTVHFEAKNEFFYRHSLSAVIDEDYDERNAAGR